ncbi:hypothetical protein Leryth_008509 [Lithospermum erythrorhizon]|nr:hypothetical protein Leryth_008509 [Lithospermum erythrorhizon]
MLREKLNVEGRKCKVRKRGNVSSSSSSSLMHNYRLKKAVLVGKRGGASTPVPMWKTSSRSPSLVNERAFKFLAFKGGEKGVKFSVSARKLAATLWETNGELSEVEMVKKDRLLKASKMSSMALKLVDPSHYPVSERMGQSKESSHRRRGSVGSQKLILAEYNQEVFDSLQNSSRSEINYALHRSPAMHGHAKKRLKEVRNGLETSKELLKVMNRIWGPEEHTSTSESLFTALKEEINRAYYHINKLIQQQRSTGSEIDLLLKQFEEEKAARKFKEHDRIHNAITSIAGELEKEKKLRRQTERLNKNLGRELADTKASLSMAIKELENEKREKEILQQVCDELVKGIGEDRAEAKKQSEKVREEVEKEREMLQFADKLREERVQMKLSEAKYEFEEKNAVVDKLRNELEACLKTKFAKNQDYGSPNFDKIKELEMYLKETLPKTCQYRDEPEGENISADSEFHSIELNMNGNRKSYEKPQRQSIPLERVTSDGIEWEFSPRKQDNSDAFDKKGVFDFPSGDWRKNYDDEIDRYNMIKNLRDHIVSSTKSASSQGFASPTKRWEEHSFTPQDHKGVESLSLPVMQGVV